MISDDAALTSVGIDIGTTTTQIIISRLTLSNVMPGSHVPKIEVSQKSILFIGGVHFTPFIDRERVDGAALRKIIAREYEKAGFLPGDIDTGAIIITGETAKKDNASEIIHSLAEFAGDFVVATAGPDLESIIAGKGSGAEELSRQERSYVANIDIGGGTTNIVFFDAGKCAGTACVNVGGRLFEVDELSHRIKYMAPAAMAVARSLGFDVEKMMHAEEASMLRMLEACLDEMVASVDRVVLKEKLTALDGELLMTDSLPVHPIDAVVFSGGVAKEIYQAGDPSWYKYGDVGPLLALAFRKGRLFTEHRVGDAEETLHATVLGAGAHTVDVSGSTITIDEDLLPLRNVPAVYPKVTTDGCSQKLDWVGAAELFSESIYRTVALVVPDTWETSYEAIVNLANQFAWQLPIIKGTPKVIVCHQDIAKVLGQTLKNILGETPLVCIDAIDLKHGDYIDIAKPRAHQDAVPVIVKTLVFTH